MLFGGWIASHLDWRSAFIIVGLPDKAVAESRERVRAALSAIGLALPPKRITVNLSPADLPKEGSHFDLPIALGLLVSLGALPADAIQGYLALGELAPVDAASVRDASATLPTTPASELKAGFVPSRISPPFCQSSGHRCQVVSSLPETGTGAATGAGAGTDGGGAAAVVGGARRAPAVVW